MNIGRHCCVAVVSEKWNCGPAQGGDRPSSTPLRCSTLWNGLYVGPKPVPGSGRVGLMEMVGEGLDHGDEPGTRGHERPEHAFVERPLGAHRAHAGSDYGAVEGSAGLGVQADLGRQDEEVVDGRRDHERDSRQLSGAGRSYEVPGWGAIIGQAQPVGVDLDDLGAGRDQSCDGVWVGDPVELEHHSAAGQSSANTRSTSSSRRS